MDFTLPPRKRAKTKEEKEQRRVERILRNRRAAHASREKKRKYVEYLESYINKLESNMDKVKQKYGGELAQLDLHEVDSLKEKIGKINKDTKDVKVSATKLKQDQDQEQEPEEPELDGLYDHQGALDDLGFKVDTALTHVIQEDLPVHDVTPVVAAEPPLPESESELSFFYLSPISINSPVYSPIDLKLDGVEQNSARILLCGA